MPADRTDRPGLAPPPGGRPVRPPGRPAPGAAPSRALRRAGGPPEPPTRPGPDTRWHRSAVPAGPGRARRSCAPAGPGGRPGGRPGRCLGGRLDGRRRGRLDLDGHPGGRGQVDPPPVGRRQVLGPDGQLHVAESVDPQDLDPERPVPAAAEQLDQPGGRAGPAPSRATGRPSSPGMGPGGQGGGRRGEEVTAVEGGRPRRSAPSRGTRPRPAPPVASAPATSSPLSGPTQNRGPGPAVSRISGPARRAHARVDHGQHHARTEVGGAPGQRPGAGRHVERGHLVGQVDHGDGRGRP